MLPQLLLPHVLMHPLLPPQKKRRRMIIQMQLQLSFPPKKPPQLLSQLLLLPQNKRRRIIHQQLLPPQFKQPIWRPPKCYLHFILCRPGCLVSMILKKIFSQHLHSFFTVQTRFVRKWEVRCFLKCKNKRRFDHD